VTGPVALTHELDPRISNTSRAEAFSDGVFAIVITLLVLDLHPPKTQPGHLAQALLAQWPTYLAYVTSYLYVGVIWLNHKAAFMHVLAMDRGLHWLNLAVLATAALVPFPTSVIAEAMQFGDPTDERAAVGLYAFVGTLMCLSWLGFFHYLGRHPELLEEHVAGGFFQLERRRASIGVVLYALAGVLGVLLSPWFASGIFLALPIFYGVTSHGLFGLEDLTRGRARGRPAGSAGSRAGHSDDEDA
jgi:uncharacterized membrane protein